MNGGNLQEQLFAWFQWFHRHPEPSGAEHETTARIREILRGIGITVIDTPLQTGLVARVDGKSEGPVVALRCDIDALPIEEHSGLSYSSGNAGYMHACGHDFHLTAMLGAAALLDRRREALKGTVKLVFQSAEETGVGAKQVLETGVLDDVREIFGLHVDDSRAPGVFSVSAGPVSAAVGGFRAVIRGKGGHASVPHECIDPVSAAGQLIVAAQTIVSRSTDPFDKVVVSITHVQAGNTWNVIPQEALLEGTIRTLGTDQFKTVAERLGRICGGVDRISGAVTEYIWQCGAPSVDNDAALADFAAKTAESLGLTVMPAIPNMGGEDFALYQQRIPGVFFTVGVGSPQTTHHPGFRANPSPLGAAAGFLAELGIRSLERTA
ncbi:MAG: amidohydrolase [Spirochaetaceae bacterium]|jgi:amidohydrolase|nr:amidohydrolase [Spirochaetaceae bacterium]